jgi:hypothetical protein
MPMKSSAFFFFGLSIFALFFVAAGIYAGIWLMLVAGIVQLIEACKATPVPAPEVAWALVKIIFFEMPILVGVILGLSAFKAAVSK